LTFFGKIELPSPEMDTKWNSAMHLLKNIFSFFEPFCPNLLQS
jgi:hypothetical protein